MNEILRPEHMGFEFTQRNWELIRAVETQQHGWIYRDGGENSLDKFLEIYPKYGSTKFRVIDLTDITQIDDLADRIGITNEEWGWDSYEYEGVQSYMIFRGLDVFAQSQLTNPNQQEADEMFLILRMALKYSAGTLFTLQGENEQNVTYDKVWDYSLQFPELHELILDHAVIYIIM